LVSALGNANAWPILKSAPFRELWPEGTKSDATSPRPEAMATFLWMDLNADGLPQLADYGVKCVGGGEGGWAVFGNEESDGFVGEGGEVKFLGGRDAVQVVNKVVVGGGGDGEGGEEREL
jgi:hypothetical protein